MDAYDIGVVAEKIDVLDSFPKNVLYHGSENKMRVLDKLLKSYPTHTESFDAFFKHELPKIFSEIKYVFGGQTTMVTNLVIVKPTYTDADGKKKPLYPYKARVDELSYSATVYGHMTTYNTEDLNNPDIIPEPIKQSKSPVELCSIPVMTKSKYCRLHGLSERECVMKGEKDGHPGGTFIHNGSEIVLPYMGLCKTNIICLFPRKKGGVSCSVTHEGKTSVVTNLSMHHITIEDMEHNVMMCANGVSRVSDETGKVFDNCNVASLIMAISRIHKLNYSDVGSVYELIYNSTPREHRGLVMQFISPTLVHSQKVGNPVKYVAMEFLHNSNISKDELKEYIDAKVLPLTPSENGGKIYTLVSMMISYIEYFCGYRGLTDRNSVATKRFSTPPKAMGSKAKMAMPRGTERLNSVFIGGKPSPEFVKQISYSISSIFKTKKGEAGSSKNVEIQRFVNYNTPSMSDQLERVSEATDVRALMPDVRSFNNSMAFYICFIKVPQNSNCGIKKSKTILTAISVNVEGSITLDALLSSKYFYEYGRKNNGTHRLFFNGASYGTCDGEKLRQQLLRARRRGSIHKHTEIFIEDGTLTVLTDSGRPVVPLFLVNPVTQKLLIDESPDPAKAWEDAPNFHSGYMEYIGSLEQNNWRFAIDESDITERFNKIEELKYRISIEKNERLLKFFKRELEIQEQNPFTHMAIHATAMYCSVANTIPFIERIQGTKSTTQANLASQALTSPDNSVNYSSGSGKFAINTCYPIVSTAYERAVNCKMGINCTVNIATDGDNIEDGIVANELVRRYLGSVSVKTHKIEIHDYANSDGYDQIRLPDMSEMTPRQRRKYRFIFSNGLPCIGAPMTKGMVLLSIIRKVEGKSINIPIRVKNGEEGVVTHVKLFTSPKNKKTIVRITLMKHNPALIGDKLCSRNGQKCSITAFRKHTEMPIAENGHTADFIMNPHAFKRMTPSLVVEGTLANYGLHKGTYVDGTGHVITTEQILDYYNSMENDGISTSSYYTLNGRRILNKLESYPLHIQLNKHTAYGPEKRTGKDTGKKDPVTGQYVKNTEDGGVKVSLMEWLIQLGYSCQNAIVSTGVDSSNRWIGAICANCGSVQTTEAKSTCVRCGFDVEEYCKRVTMAYSFNTLNQTIYSFGMTLRARIKDSKHAEDIVKEAPDNEYENEEYDIAVDDYDMYLGDDDIEVENTPLV